MLTYILIALAVIMIGFVIVVAMRPAEFRISRSATMAAPAPAAFAQVNDFHNWEFWSPWAKMDPNVKMSYEGSPSGVGAIQRWAGNNKVGEGNCTITETRPPELIRLKLQFLRPFKATNMAEFTFKPQGNQTAVTWSMSGQNNFLAKAFGLFVDCDKMVGKDFEKGLAQMKSIVESAPARATVSAV